MKFDSPIQNNNHEDDLDSSDDLRRKMIRSLSKNKDDYEKLYKTILKYDAGSRSFKRVSYLLIFLFFALIAFGCFFLYCFMNDIQF